MTQDLRHNIENCPYKMTKEEVIFVARRGTSLRLLDEKRLSVIISISVVGRCAPCF